MCAGNVFGVVAEVDLLEQGLFPWAHRATLCVHGVLVMRGVED